MTTTGASLSSSAPSKPRPEMSLTPSVSNRASSPTVMYATRRRLSAVGRRASSTLVGSVPARAAPDPLK